MSSPLETSYTLITPKYKRISQFSRDPLFKVLSFIKRYLDASFIISTKKYKTNYFNIKTKNFKQDIAYICFIKTDEAISGALLELQTLAINNSLVNYLLILYKKDSKEITWYKGLETELVEQDSTYKKEDFYPLFKKVLLLEEYYFKEKNLNKFLFLIN